MKIYRSNRPLRRGGNFPLSFCLAFAIVMFGLLGAASGQTYTKQNSRVVRFQSDTTFDSSFTVTHVNATAFLATAYVNTVDSADVHDKPQWSQVSFDLLDSALTSTNITAAGKTVTYPQLAALLRQAALDRANAAGIQ